MDEELLRIIGSLLAYPHACCPKCGQQAMRELLEQVGAMVQQSRVPAAQKHLLAEWLQLLHRLVRQYGVFDDAMLIEALKESQHLKSFIPLLPQLAVSEPSPHCALYYAQQWVKRYSANQNRGGDAR